MLSLPRHLSGLLGNQTPISTGHCSSENPSDWYNAASRISRSLARDTLQMMLRYNTCIEIKKRVCSNVQRVHFFVVRASGSHPWWSNKSLDSKWQVVMGWNGQFSLSGHDAVPPQWHRVQQQQHAVKELTAWWVDRRHRKHLRHFPHRKRLVMLKQSVYDVWNANENDSSVHLLGIRWWWSIIEICADFSTYHASAFNRNSYFSVASTRLV